MKPSLLLAFALSSLAGLSTSGPAQVGALTNPTGRPIGGGEGYGSWVDGYVVADRAQLLAALENARSGAVVYVRDDAVIDLTGTWYIPLNPGVTLASGRGRNGSLGALLYTNELTRADLFGVLGGGVRVTGLRLRGPDTGEYPTDCGGNDANGIAVYSPARAYWPVHIDNNEMWGWPQAAVATNNVDGLHVHHNHIHHCRRHVSKSGCRAYGLGYGVVSSVGSVLIEANLFDHNRHDIASDGAPGTMYEARYNLILNGAVQHSFDVHGGADRKDGTNIAGTLIYVHHNTFLQSHKPAFRIRGIPEVGAYVYANEFKHTFAGSAANQINASGNFSMWNNATSVDRMPAWFVSFSGESFWRLRRFESRAVSAVGYGDFDGDGRTDAFTTSGGAWYLSPGASADWTYLNSSSVAFSDLRFGDFNGDGRTDVFRTNGSTWYVSLSGSGPWQAWNTSSVAVGNLAFGDFNGDRRTDVLYADGSNWRVSWSGTGAWTRINTSSIRASALRCHDFNGDGRTDVFRTDGSSWYVSYGAGSAWQRINGSGIALGNLGFGDFNGDRRTDVFYGNGSAWYVSLGGTSSWQFLNHSSLTASGLVFFDFNGDRRADVLSRQHPND